MAYPVSQQFLDTLSSPTIQWAQTATILSDGIAVAGFVDLPVESITITASRASEQWYSATAVITVNPDILPAAFSSVISPNGNEITFSIGLVYPDQSTELVPMGIFPITDITIEDSGSDLTLTVDASDRSWSISRRALLVPYTIPTGITLDQAIADLVELGSAGMPSFSRSITPTTSVAPDNSYSAGEDPWEATLDIASAAGWEASFTRQGGMFAYSTPDPAQQVVSWYYE